MRVYIAELERFLIWLALMATLGPDGPGPYGSGPYGPPGPSWARHWCNLTCDTADGWKAIISVTDDLGPLLLKSSHLNPQSV